MPVIFDPDNPNRLTVDAPHGRYTVRRSQPSTNWQLVCVPEGGTVASGLFAGLETTSGHLVKGVRYGSGPFRLELLDALLLGAMAFRRREADELRQAS